MAAWTRAVIKFRFPILFVWLGVLVLGAWAWSDVSRLLSNRFEVPGMESQAARDILHDKFGERGEGTYTVVFDAPASEWRSAKFQGQARAVVRRAAGSVDGGRAGPVLRADSRVRYAQVKTPLVLVDAQNATLKVRRAMGDLSRGQTYLSGFPAVEHDIAPIFGSDLRRGELIAVPIALLVLLFMFGSLTAVSVPFLFVAGTLPGTIGLLWAAAHQIDMPVYATNLVTLIGLAIAIDYSMLIVFRYREELHRVGNPREALIATMQTAGRTVMVSGMTVAIGLAVLVLMPLPFMRGLGVAGLLVPLVSIGAATTLLPAMLAVLGTRIDRFRVIPASLLESRAIGSDGFWSKLSRSIMRRPVLYLIVAGVPMLLLATPALGLRLTAGDYRGYPETTEATKGVGVISGALGAGALAPHQIVVDSGRRNGVWSRRVVHAERRLTRRAKRDPAVIGTLAAAQLLKPAKPPRSLAAPAGPKISAALLQADPALRVAQRKRAAAARRLLAQFRRRARAAQHREARKLGMVTKDGRYTQVRISGKASAGSQPAIDMVSKLRDRYVPAARFNAAVLVGGSPAVGVDFVTRAFQIFPWLVIGVLFISLILLLRAFRSVVLPVKAVFMNLLSVSATYGILVLVFQHGWGSALGFAHIAQVEAWVPIFLFAMLFGLSMDYEIFMLSRMREEWDRSHDNEYAVSTGLERTGRIVTAAAIIMVAAFSGFNLGGFPGIQEFGLGLTVAILLDATVVRALLVPATMKLIGKWNWYLPKRLERIVGRRGLEATDSQS